MPQQGTIPNTRLTGTQTTALPATTSVWTNAAVVIDRTIAGGLNSLAPTDTLWFAIEYSIDGVTWAAISSQTWNGGSFVVKGVTVPTENDLAVGIGQPFPIGTQFRLDTVASTAVRIAGTVAYS